MRTLAMQSVCWILGQMGYHWLVVDPRVCTVGRIELRGK